MSETQGLGLIFLVASGALTLDQLYVLFRAHASVKWHRTQGKITASTVAPVSLTDLSYTDVQPLVRYRYSVEGVEYEGQTLSIGEGWWSLFGRRKFPILDEFPIGDSVTVFYNPRRPADSALLVGPELSTYLRPLAAGAIALWALSLVL